MPLARRYVFNKARQPAGLFVHLSDSNRLTVGFHDELMSLQMKPALTNAVQPLRWDCRQSAFALTRATRTELDHKLSGGRPPYRFSAAALSEAMSLDPTTGRVSIDNASMCRQASQAINDYAISLPADENLDDALVRYARSLIPAAIPVLGRQPSSFPVAVPIHLEAADQDNQTLDIQYAIIVEVPFAVARQELFALAARRRGTQQDPEGRPATAADELKQLQNRIDRISRGLSEMLHQIDQLQDRLD